MSRAITRLFLPAVLLAVLAGVVGIVLLIIPSTRLVGMILVVFAVPMFFAAGAGALLSDETPPAALPRLARSGLLAVAGLGLCLPLAVLGAIGLLERHTTGYAFKYGDAVTAHVPDSCTEYVSQSGDKSSIDCDAATWVDRGKQVTGTLSVTNQDLKTANSSTYTVKDLPAWAYQRHAWSTRLKTSDFSVPLGRLPGWMVYLFAPAALALVPWILLTRRADAVRPAAR